MVKVGVNLNIGASLRGQAASRQIIGTPIDVARLAVSEHSSDSAHRFGGDNSGFDRLDAEMTLFQHGDYARNGHVHANFQPSSSTDKFYGDIGRLCGDSDADPEEDGDKRMEIAREIFDALARFLIPTHNIRVSPRYRPRRLLYLMGSRLATLLCRIKPDLLPACLRSEVDISKASNVSRACISRRIAIAGDELKIHLGLRSPAARERFRQAQRLAWSKRGANGKTTSKAKPPSKRT